MNGLHLTADLSGCAAEQPALRDVGALRDLCLAAVRAAGLTPVGELFHSFGEHSGATGVVLLAESHLAVHTWPELGAVTLDAYVCNLGGDNSERARQLLGQMVRAFAPTRVQRQQLQRGQVASGH